MGNKKKEIDIAIIVPHEDDELIVAGEVIYQAVKNGKNVKVIFATNGDYNSKKEGERRIKEAIEALSVLGVKEKDIVFLGYGDQIITKHLYNGCENEVLPSHNGNTLTYGIEGKEDFSLQEYGCHHVYTRENYKKDIKQVLENYAPQIIITTDWDDHMDHVALSLMVDECIGELLKENKLNVPLVLKTQSYTGKWEGPIDFWGNDNVTKNYNCFFGTEHVHPLNKWEDRIRFVSPCECSTRLLRKSILYKSACAYASQGADIKARQFVNDDVVYWRRYTDSLTYQAKITVSSGEGKYLNDFKCVDCTDVAHQYRTYDKSIWIPDNADKEKRIYIEFEEKKVIQEVWLYENSEEESHIENCMLKFADGTIMETGDLHEDGSCTRVVMPRLVQTEWIELTLAKVRGNHAGLAEVEIYDRIKKIAEYPMPLRLWQTNDTAQRRQGISCWIEKVYFSLINRARGRLWPNKWLLMQKYHGLSEKDSFLRFWQAHLQFVIERVFLCGKDNKSE